MMDIYPDSENGFMGVHMSNLIALDNLNMCSLLYVSRSQ